MVCKLDWSKRRISLLAALALVLAMSPVRSWAEEGSASDTPEEALEAVEQADGTDTDIEPLEDAEAPTEPLAASQDELDEEGRETLVEAEPEPEPAPELESEPTLEPQLTRLEILKADGNWNKKYLEASNIESYQESGDISDLTFNIWVVTVSKKCTLSIDALSKDKADFEFYLSEKTNETIGDFVHIKPGTGGSIREELEPGDYYINVISVAPGDYEIRAYTETRSLANGATYNGKSSITSLGKKAYTGAQVKPAVVVAYQGEKLIENLDYTIAYAPNKKVGTGKVTITGKGLYAGTKQLTFKIVKRSIKKCKIKVGTKAWTGKAIKAKPTVKIGSTTLKKGTDYTIVKYTKNRHIGTATMTIKGKGGLKGTRTVKFKIRYNISKVGDVVGYYQEGKRSFTRFVFKKTNTVMKKGRDYKLTVYIDDSTKKTYKMVGRGDYSGTAYFSIYK